MRHRKTYPLVALSVGAAAAAAGLLTGAPARAAAPEPSAARVPANSVELAAAAQLAHDQGVTTDEALRRIQRQPAIERLQADLAQAIPDYYSGVYVDHARGGAVVVLTTAPRREVAEAADKEGLSSVVVRQPAQFSLRDLDAAYDDAAAGLPAVQDTTSVVTLEEDVQHNVVHVDLPRGRRYTPSQQNWRARLDRSHPGHWSDGTGEDGATAATLCAFPFCDPPLRGGVWINPSQSDTGGMCTSGFTVAGQGTKYVLTAGHCIVGNETATWYEKQHIDNVWHAIGRVALWQFNATHGDEAILSINNIPGWNPAGIVYDRSPNGQGDNPQYSIRSVAGAPAPGVYICHTGITSGTNCGPFTMANATATYGGVTETHLGKVAFTACQGDSGGPVFGTSNQGYGMLVALDSSRTVTAPNGQTVGCTDTTAYYQSLALALQEMNVTLVAGP